MVLLTRKISAFQVFPASQHAGLERCFRNFSRRSNIFFRGEVFKSFGISVFFLATALSKPLNFKPLKYQNPVVIGPAGVLTATNACLDGHFIGDPHAVF